MILIIKKFSEHNRFIFTLFLHVTCESFQKFWIFFFVNGAEDGRGSPSSGINDGTISQITGDIVARWRFTIFWFSDVRLTE